MLDMQLYMQIIYANYMQMSMYIEIRCIMAPNYHILVLTNWTSVNSQ